MFILHHIYSRFFSFFSSIFQEAVTHLSDHQRQQATVIKMNVIKKRSRDLNVRRREQNVPSRQLDEHDNGIRLISVCSDLWKKRRGERKTVNGGSLTEALKQSGKKKCIDLGKHLDE